MTMQPTGKTKLRRSPKRGKYDKTTIHAILDAHFLCHVGFIYKGYPVVIPTLYGRSGDVLYIHGATSSRMLKTLKAGGEASITITRIDGLVLARSAFHHSMNYRSVVLFGKAGVLEDDREKLRGLKTISDQLIPGRWEEVRPPNKKELKATMVLTFPIREASAKIRSGPPKDEPEDYNLNIWAGELPVLWSVGRPLNDPLLKEDLPVPESIRGLNGWG